MRELLQRDSFCAPEVDIFRAVHTWSSANPDGDLSTVLNEVRLPLMSIEELLDVVRPAGFVSPEVILDAIQTITLPGDTKLRYRGCLRKLLFCLFIKYYYHSGYHSLLSGVELRWADKKPQEIHSLSYGPPTLDLLLLHYQRKI